MPATIDRINLKNGESMVITARGSAEVCIAVRESGGRLIIVGPMNHNSKTIIIEQDVKVEAAKKEG